MNSPDYFDRDYFMNGIHTGKSLYQNYRWMPEVSIPMAAAIKGLYPFCSVLDYGCAMGYLVYALRLLGVEAYGYDISDFAVENAHDSIINFIYDNKVAIPRVDVIFGKDVLEHSSKEFVRDELESLLDIAPRACFIIPMGSNGFYRIHDYEKDQSHLIREDEEWWIKKFIASGWKKIDFSYHIEGIKDNWFQINPKGNAVFMVEQ